MDKLVVSSVRKDTSEAIVVTLEIPTYLREKFGFKHGQYLTLNKTIDGEETRRPYSICTEANNAPEFLEVAIKRVEGGVFSSWAHANLKVEDKIEVMSPEGYFTSTIMLSEGKTYCCLAVGSGITPILSIIKTILGQEQKSRIILIYGNRRLSSVMFLEEINVLKNRYIDRLQVCHVLSREPNFSGLLSGRISPQKVVEIIEKTNVTIGETEFFICGPKEMSNDTSSLLIKTGVNPKSINQEFFGQPSDDVTLGRINSLSKKGTSMVNLKYGGRSYEIRFLPQEKTVLEAALEQGIDLPYSCKAGACTTCRAVLIEGEVDMGKDHVLDDESVAAGYILTCQSRPISQKVLIDLDQKR